MGSVLLMGAPPKKKSTCEFCNEPCDWRRNDQGSLYRLYLWTHTATGEAHCHPDTADHRKVKPVDYCIERVRSNDRHNEICNRPVTNAELGTCGIHMKFERDRRERLEKRDFEEQMRQYVKAMIDPMIEHWNAYYDLDAHPEEDYGDVYTGYIAVNPGRLNDLLQKIEETL